MEAAGYSETQFSTRLHGVTSQYAHLRIILSDVITYNAH